MENKKDNNYSVFYNGNDKLIEIPEIYNNYVKTRLQTNFKKQEFMKSRYVNIIKNQKIKEIEEFFCCIEYTDLPNLCNVFNKRSKYFIRIIKKYLNNKIISFIFRETSIFGKSSLLGGCVIKHFQCHINDVNKCLRYMSNSVTIINVEYGLEMCENLNNKLKTLIINSVLITNKNIKTKLPKYSSLVIQCGVFKDFKNTFEKTNIKKYLKSNYKMCIVENYNM